MNKNLENFIIENAEWLRKYVYMGVKALTFLDFKFKTNLQIKGREYVEALPETGVVFVSNHETYYLDVLLMCDLLWTSGDKSFFNIRDSIFFIAADETAKQSPLLKFHRASGTIPFRRQWKAGDELVNREADYEGMQKIKAALDEGWLINFPTGTTNPDAKMRDGTAKFLKKENPIVVPVKITGSGAAYGKRGILSKGFRMPITVEFFEPFKTENMTEEQIMQVLSEKTGCKR